MIKYMVILYVNGVLYDTKVYDTQKDADAIKVALNKINGYKVKVKKVVV